MALERDGARPVASPRRSMQIVQSDQIATIPLPVVGMALAPATAVSDPSPFTAKAEIDPPARLNT